MNNAAVFSFESNPILAGHMPGEQSAGIYDLCRELVSTNTLDVLLKSIVRQSVDILNVRFSRILTLEPDGSFICQATHSRDGLDLSYRRKLRVSTLVQPLYQSAILRETPLILEDGGALPNDLRHALHIGPGDSLCMVPLRVSLESLGILVLGEERKADGKGMMSEKLRMAAMIADQAAGAIYRARLSYRLEESQLQTVLALAKVMESRDPDTGNHSRKVTVVAVRLARKLNVSPVEEQSIRWAAMLHDIGKVGIRDDILKKNGSLDQTEWDLMRRHPEIGADIVRMASNLNYVAGLIQAHHERYDGSGYPYGLQRELIPYGARILSIADAFSAMTDQTHNYRACRPLDEALGEIRRCSGSQFDPHIVDTFVSLFS